MKTLREMVFRQRCSAAVWLALAEIANKRGRKSFSISREGLSAACGVRPRSISRALAGLEYCGWIKRRVIRINKGSAFVSKMRITLRHQWRLAKRCED